MAWSQFRERANLFLFKNKESVLGAFKAVNIVVTLLAIGTMIWIYGFKLNENENKLALLIIKGSFSFYIIHYLARIIYDFHPLEFIRSTWFEATMVILLIIEGFSYSVFDTLLIETIFANLGFAGFRDISTVIIQIYFLVVVITEFLRNSDFLPRIRLNPAVVFVLSFVFIIMGGTFLLMLPEMTTKGINFVDALFTATSATCVTGLMTLDPHTAFTFKGQFVILMLIKLGGLNIIAFGGFLSLMSKVGVGIRHHQVIEGFVARNNILSASGMLGKVILWTIVIEGLGAVALYQLWNPEIAWYDNGEKLFYSIFHSVSAFNNAGISLFTNGLTNEMVSNNYLVHWVIIIQIFLGGLGILALFDLFEPSRLRDRLKNPWKQIDFSTKISLYFSIGLVLIGAVLIYAFESEKSLSEHSLFGKITGAVFQSVTPRTAGYNTVDFGVLSVPSVMLIIALMYIGAGSTSTGGGIKTSSLAIIIADIKAVMTGQDRAVLFKRTIGPALKSSAYSIAIIYIVMNFIGVLLLSISEWQLLLMPQFNVADLVFEQVSAFSTVGLSRNLTAYLSETGRYIIIASMFVGRVGTFTIAFALAGKFVLHKFKYPEADTIVG
ncbi:MAG: TrkH family potassium uptake protein [Flavobacteriales bacterium]|jgi:trk system potassium uptake protein TrkH